MSKFVKFLLFIFMSILVATPIIPVSIKKLDSTTNFSLFRRQINPCYDAAKSARRSVTITLINKCGTDIFLTVATLKQGKWTLNCDANLAKVIKNGQEATFASQSDGIDAEGSATYIIGDAKPPTSLTINWANPLIGVNKYSVILSDNKYSKQIPLPGNGDNALYQVIIT